MGCGVQLLKIIMFILNIVICLVGIAISAGCIFFLVVTSDLDTLDELKDVTLKSPFAVLLAAGIILALLGFLGCCGACMESQCMLLTYFILLLVIIGVEIAGIALGWKLPEKLEQKLGQALLEGVQKYDNADVKKLMDGVQKTLKCCGAKGASDYLLYGTRQVPPSCYKDEKVTNTAYPGCQDIIKDLMKKGADGFGGAIIAAIIIQGSALVVSMCLYFNVREIQKGFA